MSLKDFKGVLTGDQVQELFEIAKEHKFALPAVNIIGNNKI
jgi:fructose-bisphosphate aldolase class II